MKITYLANVRIPTEKAHGIQIMKMCQAFVQQGSEVELVVARRYNPRYRNINPFEFYSVTDKFKITRILLIDMVARRLRLGGLSVIIQNTTFALSSLIYLIWNRQDILYTRDQFSAFLLVLFRKNLVYEIHTMPHKALGIYKYLFRKVKKIIAITDHIKKDLVKLGADPEKILVAHDAVDLKDFNIKINKIQCRKDLGLPIDKKIAMYIGHLYEWKGVYVLAESTKFLTGSVEVVFVGGTKPDIKSLKDYIEIRKLSRISFIPLQPHKKVPVFLQAADVLVLPNSGKKRISRLYTSPIKLFEYMASKKPIVATLLPSIQEVLDKTTAEMVKADSAEALADGINSAVELDTSTLNRVNKSWDRVQQFSWSRRAENIIRFIS